MRTVLLIFAALIVPASPQLAAETPSLQESPARRRPVAAVLTGDGRSLYVANSTSGTLSLIDLETRQVVSEQRLGGQLSSLALLPDAGLLLVTDRATHELLVVEPRGGTFATGQRIPVARHPVSVIVSPDGRTIAVAGLWSRRVTLLSRSNLPGDVDAANRSETSDLKSQISDHKSQISDRAVITPKSSVRLPFAPRRQLFLEDGRWLMVMDAFGGQIALIDVRQAAIESVRPLPAQNIRGAALSADGSHLLLTHQVLSPLARADFDDIHWGNLLRNDLCEISVEALLDPQADLFDGSRTVALGQVGRGAADPAGLALLPALDGWIACLSGTGEVRITTRHGGGRVSVGAQPVDVLWDAPRGLAYVLCRLEDAVAVIDPVRQQVVDTISLGPQPTPTPADRGERLFVDGLRSHDGWLSCQSCHPDGHTTGGLADTSSDGTYGTPKRILSLLGTRDSNPWAWNGEFRGLHEQVASSLTSTMQGEALSAAKISDIVAYLHLLTPPPPVDDGEWTPEQQSQIVAGRGVFNRLRCGRCHVPPQTFTIDQAFDVGLEDEEGLQKFNPPSLRGVGQRERLFHDGRADSLDAVIDEFGHQVDGSLSDKELASLLVYLRSL